MSEEKLRTGIKILKYTKHTKFTRNISLLHFIRIMKTFSQFNKKWETQLSETYCWVPILIIPDRPHLDISKDSAIQGHFEFDPLCEFLPFFSSPGLKGHLSYCHHFYFLFLLLFSEDWRRLMNVSKHDLVYLHFL